MAAFVAIFFLVPLVFIGLVILIIVLNVRRKNEEWKGVIEDKKRFRGRNSANYYIYFCKDTGEKCRYRVSRSRFDTYNIGDKVEKVKGQSFPIKVTM